MKKNHKILICVWFFLIIFGIFSWENFYKNFTILTHFDDSLPENRYNKALELSRNQDFSGALNVLPENMEYFPERLAELRGDLLYEQKANSGAIIAQYEQSLQLVENARIRDKIRLIRGEVTSEDTWETATNAEEKTEEIQQAEEQIARDQERRAEYINSYNSSKNFRKDIQDIKNLLETDNFSERKDW